MELGKDPFYASSMTSHQEHRNWKKKRERERMTSYFAAIRNTHWMSPRERWEIQTTNSENRDEGREWGGERTNGQNLVVKLPEKETYKRMSEIMGKQGPYWASAKQNDGNLSRKGAGL